MREMPQEIKSMLKSKSMVGENSPCAEVIFKNKKSGYSETEWNTKHFIRGGTYWSYYGGGSFVTRKDGKVLVTYENDNNIMLSVVDSEDDLFYYDNRAATNEWIFYTRYSTSKTNLYTNSMLQKLSTGKILLYIHENGVLRQADKPNKVFVYESSNGLGTDFIYKATIKEVAVTNYTYIMGGGDLTIGQPIEIKTGRILMPFTSIKYFSGTNGRLGLYCGYSDDGGVTWNVSVVGDTNNYYTGIRGIGCAGEQLIILTHSYYGVGTSWLRYSNDYGQTWIVHSAYIQKKSLDMNNSHVFWGNGDGYTYMLYDNANPNPGQGYLIYRHNANEEIDFTGQIPYEMGEIGSGATWEGPLRADKIGDDLYERLYVTEAGNIAFLGTTKNIYYEASYIIGGKRELLSAKIPVSTINVSRDRGAVAQRCSIEFPNVNPNNPKEVGYYSPDREGEWQGIVLPGSEIEVKFGYGEQLVEGFTGEIDEVLLDAKPKEYNIKIDCRDKACILIDKKITDDLGNYFIKYQDKSIEFIVRDLLKRSGFDDVSITTEETGISVSKTFERVTYADAIEWCLNISGFDLVIDEQGKVSFHFPTDRQPASIDEEVALIDTETSNLLHKPIVSNSDKVTGIDGTTVYVRDIDYTIDLSNGTIARTENSSIPSGATVLVTYVYAAYVFKEGEDLFFLPYRLSRRDLYGKIRVTGKDTEGKVIHGEFILSNPENYGIYPEKVLFIEDESLDTNEKLQLAANQLGQEMKRCFRELSFGAVAVPWLQVGDCVQVIESSSTVSEVYRITSLDFDFGEDGFTMQATAYHYGYTPL